MELQQISPFIINGQPYEISSTGDIYARAWQQSDQSILLMVTNNVNITTPYTIQFTPSFSGKAVIFFESTPALSISDGFLSDTLEFLDVKIMNVTYKS